LALTAVECSPVKISEFAFRLTAHYALSQLPYVAAVGLHATNNYLADAKLLTSYQLDSNQPLVGGLASLALGYVVNRIGARISITHGKVQLPCTTVDVPQVLDKRIVIGDPFDGKEQYFDHIGLGFSDCIPIVHASNSTNELAALQGRVYGNPLVADVKQVDAFCKFMVVAHDELVEIPYCPMDAMFDSHVGARCNWNSAKRFGKKMVKIHNDAFDDCRWGLLPTSHYRKLFVKREKKNCVLPDTVEEIDAGDPRHIQSVSQHVHSTLGPFIYAWSKCLSQCWCLDYWITYAAGSNGSQLFSCLDQFPVYFTGDLSRFDRSIHKKFLNTLNDMKFKHCIPVNARKCLDMQRNTIGFTMKGGHKYTVPGQRKSGDANTSCDNSELNVYMHLWCITRQLNVDLKWCASNLKVIVMGDDIVIGGPSELTNVDFKTMLATIGFSSKPKFVHDRRDVEFCSRWFWEVGDGGCLAAKPGKLLARVGFSHQPICEALFPSIAKGLLIDNSCVPFVREYLGHVAKGDPYFKRGCFEHMTERLEPTAETYDQLEWIYGFDHNHVKHFSDWIKAWDGGPAMGQHEYVSHLFRKDL
jgi:hypothetical protein